MAVIKHFRLIESCSIACTPSSGHHPQTHERFGRNRALAHLRAPVPAVVETGPLVVDLALNQITVDGAEPSLTRIQAEVLQTLAEAPGRTYCHRELVTRVWGPIQADLWCHRTPSYGTWHGLRIHIYRLKQRLGPAGPLIENIPNRGYRLRIEPPSLEGPLHE